jgi:hypothetical protein
VVAKVGVFTFGIMVLSVQRELVSTTRG